MHTVDQIAIRAPIDRVFQVASHVERWPAILPHYRWVRMLRGTEDGALVEMAAWRPFGVFRYPTWWVSEMTVDRRAGGNRHPPGRGVTRGGGGGWGRGGEAGGGDGANVHGLAGARGAPVRPLGARLVIRPM